MINSKKESGNQQNNNNSSINININNNGNASSKWIIKQENQDITNINNSNNNSNTFSNLNFKKRKVNNFTKNNIKYSPSGSSNSNGNLNIRTRYTKYEPDRVENGFKTKNHKGNGTNTMNNNNAFTASYSKILNNIFVRINKSPNKKQSKSKNKNKKKNSSISMYLEEYDKSSMENKYLNNKMKKYNSNRKNINGYSRIIGLIPNSKFPLSSKHHKTKKNYAHSLPKKHLQKDKNYASYSALIINRK